MRLYDLDESLLAVHRKVPAGGYAPGQPGLAEPATNRRAFTLRLLGRCERVGVELHGWAMAALEDRGVRALRLIQGVLKLVRKYPREAVLAAAATATKNRLFRYRDLVRILEHRSAREPSSRQLSRENESIRPMTQYTLEGFL